MLLCLGLEQFSENLQRSDFDVMEVSMVLSDLSETEEAEACLLDLGDIEVPSHVRVVQVVVTSTAKLHQWITILRRIESVRRGFDHISSQIFK